MIKKGKYKHYKGKVYEVLGEAIHSETKELLVVYKALYGNYEPGKELLFVRPKEMFAENVVVDGKEIPRFKHVG